MPGDISRSIISNNTMRIFSEVKTIKNDQCINGIAVNLEHEIPINRRNPINFAFKIMGKKDDWHSNTECKIKKWIFIYHPYSIM